MSSLSKKLIILFAIVAGSIIILVSVLANINLITSIKRILIGSIGFSFFGGLIGQVISLYLNEEQLEIGDSIGRAAQEVAANEDIKASNNQDAVSPLEFEQLRQDDLNMINDNPDKLAQVIQGIKE